MNSPTRLLKALHVSDVRGLADVAVQATRDVTAVVEGVHRSVHATLGLPGGQHPGRTTGITGLVYRSIDGITRLTGAGLRASLAFGEPLARRLGHEPLASREREVLLGILNGVLGDQLAATRNPLALPMTLRYRGQEIGRDEPQPSTDVGGRLLVMIHGLCMTDHGWRPREDDARPDMGAVLAARLGHTPLYLRYNSGRAVTANGLDLAKQLEKLVEYWPVPVEEITLLGHSMGGLLARSAVAHGARLGHAWPRRLSSLVFLGTPHHGAPLERAGAWVETLLHATPYTRPFAALSSRRSRGIRDLRHGEIGSVENGSRPGADRGKGPDRSGTRAAPRLPAGVRVLAVAGTRASRARAMEVGVGAGDLPGDGLVPVASALGKHPDAERDLCLPDSSRLVIPGTSHMGLLG
ncbi:MAG: alpha/beta hydrolase, partial [Gammaproteobacteria bacterium]